MRLQSVGTMADDEVTNLRYCYELLRRRVEVQGEDWAYWQMNLRLVTFFLRRYDPTFDPTHWRYDDPLSEDEKSHIETTHALLQRPTPHRPAHSGLTRQLEEDLKRRVACYLAARA